MKRFVLKVGMFLALQAAVFLAMVGWHDGSQTEGYLAASIGKHERLEQARSPRIILVGGSNLAFGMNSPRLEEKTGCAVVNMGLVAGVGLDFMLSEVEGAVRRGDLVVLSLEYDAFSAMFNPAIIRQLLAVRPASAAYLSSAHSGKVIISEGLSIVGEITRRALAFGPVDEEVQYPYVRRGFNRWGDLTNHYGAPRCFEYKPEAMQEGFRELWIPRERTLARLERFGAMCQKRGAAFVYSCPPHPIEAVRRHAATLTAVMERLRGIETLRLVDTPEDQAYPTESFYDTGYHLNQPAVNERTDRVAVALKSILNPSTDESMLLSDR